MKRTSCLPILHLPLLQLHSCVEGKKEVMSMTVVEVRSSNEFIGDKSTMNKSPIKATEEKGSQINEAGEGKVSKEIVKTCNTIAAKGDPYNELGPSVKGNLPPTLVEGTWDDDVMETQKISLDKARMPREDLSVHIDNLMCNAHSHAESLRADNKFCALKQTQIHQVKPNIATIAKHKDEVFALAVAGDLLYTASQSKDIRVFRAPMFEEVDCFGSGNGVVQTLVAFGERLYSAHQDNKIRVWRRVNFGDSGCKHKLATVLPRLDQCVKSMLLQKNYVQVRRHKRKLWIEHADTISALALGGGGSDNGRCSPNVLYSASWDKTVKVWSLNDFKCMESFYAHHDAINAMIVIDASVLTTASADCTIKLWTKASYPTRKKRHSLLSTLEGHKAAVNALAVSANAKTLYSGGSDGALIVWKRVYSKPQGRSIKTTMSRDLSEEMQVQNGVNAKGEVIRRANSKGNGEISRANSATKYIGLSVNPRRVSYSQSSVNFRMKKLLAGHARAVLSVSAVGDHIVCSSSADKTIRVWGRRGEKGWEYECVAVLAGHAGPVKSIASITPAASHSLHAHAPQYVEHLDTSFFLYSGGLDSKVKVWALG